MRTPISPQKSKIILAAILAGLIISVVIWLVGGLHIAILDPKGIIAQKQYNLLVFTTILGFIVVIPVFVMAIVIAWRYRESNTTATYTPNVSTNRLAETIWWGIPIALITILSVVTWTSTVDLDPFKPLPSSVKPVKVQVVALDWKWLFIYPEQNIATVNFVQFPVNTPVDFELTADAPMNSFWIPQLGGQIYAMSGMKTQLHLNATEMGDYKGSSANISGEGFSGMKFTARASSKADFDKWVAASKKTANHLTNDTYATLASKSKNNPVSYYSSVTSGLYDTILMKNMTPESANSSTASHDMSHMEGMDHSMSNMEGMDHSHMEMSTH